MKCRLILRLAVAVALLAAISSLPTPAGGSLAAMQLNPPLRLYVLDLKGDGVKLTSVKDGVEFDVDSAGSRVRTAWTAAGTDDAFIVVKPQPSGNLRAITCWELGCLSRMADD